MPKKLKVGVLFGGKSAEHEVSLVSAQAVIENLNKNKYEAIPIGITREGKWISAGKPLEYLKKGRKNEIRKNALPGVRKNNVGASRGSPASELATTARVKNYPKIDVIFPVLHGTYGEDGTVQGFLELADIPYVGAGVLGSALGMDKVIQKKLFKAHNLPVVPHLTFARKQILERLNPEVIKEIERALDYPCFTKPANLGSSVGIFKAHTRQELKYMIKKSARFDCKIVVEKVVPNAREIEVSVLGNGSPKVSVCGEIISSNEFYDYDAKYIDGKSKAIIPAKISKRVSNKVRGIAKKAFLALDCAGMARVDFLVDGKTNKIYLSELNTIPGFTSISMYPKLWQASGLSYPRLLDQLIRLALARHRDKQKIETMVQLKKDWYR